MRKAPILAVAWALILAFLLGGLYLYIYRSSHGVVADLRDFFTDSPSQKHGSLAKEGWFDGMRIHQDNYKLYPANEISLSIPLEHYSSHGRYEIEISKLTADNLLNLQKVLQPYNVRLSLHQADGRYTASAYFDDKDTMLRVYENIKKQSFEANFTKRDER